MPGDMEDASRLGRLARVVAITPLASRIDSAEGIGAGAVARAGTAALETRARTPLWGSDLGLCTAGRHCQ
ncbi:hypothetical protein ACFYYN_24915 [Streptomyces sp. NPDC001902]